MSAPLWNVFEVILSKLITAKHVAYYELSNISQFVDHNIHFSRLVLVTEIS